MLLFFHFIFDFPEQRDFIFPNCVQFSHRWNAAVWWKINLMEDNTGLATAHRNMHAVCEEHLHFLRGEAVLLKLADTAYVYNNSTASPPPYSDVLLFVLESQLWGMVVIRQPKRNINTPVCSEVLTHTFHFWFCLWNLKKFSSYLSSHEVLGMKLRKQFFGSQWGIQSYIGFIQVISQHPKLGSGIAIPLNPYSRKLYFISFSDKWSTRG